MCNNHGYMIGQLDLTAVRSIVLDKDENLSPRPQADTYHVYKQTWYEFANVKKLKLKISKYQRINIYIITLFI